MTLDCKILSEMSTTLEEDLGVDLLTGLQVVLAHCWRRLGRVSSSKLLGISERKVRRIIESLKNHQLFAKAGSPGFFETVLNGFQADLIFEREDFYLVAYKSFSRPVLDLVKSRIVEFRDYLVMGCGSPNDLLMIGVSRDGDEGVEFPRVPKKYFQPLLNIITFSEVRESLIIVWRAYEPVKSDAIVLYALSRLCKTVSR